MSKATEKADTVEDAEQPEQPSEQPFDAPAEALQALPAGTEVLTWPNWGPPEPDQDKVISLHQLQLAQFHGNDPDPTAQAHLERFEDFLRSHGIGGSNRKSEGAYGDKTRELVDTAYEKLLGRTDANGTIGDDLLDALRRMGAVVSG